MPSDRREARRFETKGVSSSCGANRPKSEHFVVSGDERDLAVAARNRLAGLHCASGSCWAIITISWVRGASRAGSVAAVSQSAKLAGSRILPQHSATALPRLKLEKAKLIGAVSKHISDPAAELQMIMQSPKPDVSIEVRFQSRATPRSTGSRCVLHRDNVANHHIRCAVRRRHRSQPAAVHDVTIEIRDNAKVWKRAV